jgi:hypothetical protein
MFMVVQFLCARYPTHFFFNPLSGMFRNDILGSTYDTNTVESLHFLLDNVPEDFLIVLKDEATGFYHLKAAVSASAIGFSLKEKRGKPLHEIHDPVPDYAEKLKLSMDRCVGPSGFECLFRGSPMSCHWQVLQSNAHRQAYPTRLVVL